MRVITVPITLLLMLTSSATTAVEVFTNSALFFTALDGTPQVIDFETFADGDTFTNPFSANGTAISVIPFDGAAVSPFVTSEYSQTTPGGANSLGLNTLEQAFLAGDGIQFAFPTPVSALGLFIIGFPGEVEADDFLLTIGGSTVANSATPDQTLPGGGEVFFLGLVETTPGVGHATAVLNSFDPGAARLFAFNLDDITVTVVPLPPALVLFIGAVFSLLPRFKRTS